jgi:hypothetical protein
MTMEPVRVITVALAGSDDRSTTVWQTVFIPGNGFFPGVTGAFARRGSTHARSLVCELK